MLHPREEAVKFRAPSWFTPAPMQRKGPIFAIAVFGRKYWSLIHNCTGIGTAGAVILPCDNTAGAASGHGQMSRCQGSCACSLLCKQPYADGDDCYGPEMPESVPPEARGPSMLPKCSQILSAEASRGAACRSSCLSWNS